MRGFSCRMTYCFSSTECSVRDFADYRVRVATESNKTHWLLWSCDVRGWASWWSCDNMICRDNLTWFSARHFDSLNFSRKNLLSHFSNRHCANSLLKTVVLATARGTFCLVTAFATITSGTSYLSAPACPAAMALEAVKGLGIPVTDDQWIGLDWAVFYIPATNDELSK